LLAQGEPYPIRDANNPPVGTGNEGCAVYAGSANCLLRCVLPGFALAISFSVSLKFILHDENYLALF
jgi:hypothetical protein